MTDKQKVEKYRQMANMVIDNVLDELGNVAYSQTVRDLMHELFILKTKINNTDGAIETDLLVSDEEKVELIEKILLKATATMSIETIKMKMEEL